MQINFLTFDEWGMDSWCIQDYKADYDKSTADIKNNMLACLILFNDDLEYPNQSFQFIKMCEAAGASIIVIETCWLENIPEISDWLDELREYTKELGYVENPDCYETKLVFYFDADEINFKQCNDKIVENLKDISDKYEDLCDKISEEGWEPGRDPRIVGI